MVFEDHRSQVKNRPMTRAMGLPSESASTVCMELLGLAAAGPGPCAFGPTAAKPSSSMHTVLADSDGGSVYICSTSRQLLTFCMPSNQASVHISRSSADMQAGAAAHVRPATQAPDGRQSTAANAAAGVQHVPRWDCNDSDTWYKRQQVTA